MTTRLELEHQGETIVVTGQYFHQSPSDFAILKVEQGGWT